MTILQIASELEELKGELEWLKINPHPDIKRKLQAVSEFDLYIIR